MQGKNEEKKPGEHAPMANIRIGQHQAHTDTVKTVPGPGASKRYQDQSGKYRQNGSYPLPPSPSKPKVNEAKIGLNIPLANENIFGVALKANAAADPSGANINGEVTIPIYESPIFGGTFTFNAASLGVQASIGTEGVGQSVHISGPTVTYDLTKTYCINSQTSLTLNGSLTFGVGAGYS